VLLTNPIEYSIKHKQKKSIKGPEEEDPNQLLIYQKHFISYNS